MYKLGKHRGDALISSIVAAAVTGALCLGVAKTVGTTMQSQTKVVGSVHATTYADTRIQILKNTPYNELSPIAKTEIENLGEAGIKYYESVEFGEETTTNPIGKWATISIYEDNKTEAIGKFKYFCIKGGFTEIPQGTIVMWHGVNIPNGWHICDGTNGTPNLRDRFIVGAGSSYSLQSTGGAATVTLNLSQIPPHSHSFSRPRGDQWWDNGSGNTWWGGSFNVSSNTSSAGGGEAHENRPPYYALYYIMKL